MKQFFVTRDAICQWFLLVISSLVKIIGKSPHWWPKIVIHSNSYIIPVDCTLPLLSSPHYSLQKKCLTTDPDQQNLGRSFLLLSYINFGKILLQSSKFQISFWRLTLLLRQNGCHYLNTIFECIILNRNVWILIKISMKFVPKGPFNNIPT